MRKPVRDQQTRLTTLSSYTGMPHFGLFMGRNGRGAEETEGGEEGPGAGASLLRWVCFFPSHLLPAGISQAAASPGTAADQSGGQACLGCSSSRSASLSCSKKGNNRRKMIGFSPSLKRLNIRS